MGGENNKAIKDANCVMVLIFPKGLAAMVTLSDAARMRKPVMANSLATMMMTPQAGIIPSSTNIIKAEIVSTLSAKGSRNFPKVVTRLCFRAKWPSRKSVKAATQKTRDAVRRVAGVLIRKRMTKTGTRNRRMIVSLFAMFNVITT